MADYIAGSMRHLPGELIQVLSAKLFILLFADDVVLLSHTQEGMGGLYEQFVRFCEEAGLMISPTETNLMVSRID